MKEEHLPRTSPNRRASNCAKGEAEGGIRHGHTRVCRRTKDAKRSSFFSSNNSNSVGGGLFFETSGGKEHLLSASSFISSDECNDDDDDSQGASRRGAGAATLKDEDAREGRSRGEAKSHVNHKKHRASNDRDSRKTPEVASKYGNDGVDKEMKSHRRKQRSNHRKESDNKGGEQDEGCGTTKTSPDSVQHFGKGGRRRSSGTIARCGRRFDSAEAWESETTATPSPRDSKGSVDEGIASGGGGERRRATAAWVDRVDETPKRRGSYSSDKESSTFVATKTIVGSRAEDERPRVSHFEYVSDDDDDNSDETNLTSTISGSHNGDNSDRDRRGLVRGTRNGRNSREDRGTDGENVSLSKVHSRSCASDLKNRNYSKKNNRRRRSDSTNSNSSNSSRGGGGSGRSSGSSGFGDEGSGNSGRKNMRKTSAAAAARGEWFETATDRVEDASGRRNRRHVKEASTSNHTGKNRRDGGDTAGGVDLSSENHEDSHRHRWHDSFSKGSAGTRQRGAENDRGTRKDREPRKRRGGGDGGGGRGALSPVGEGGVGLEQPSSRYNSLMLSYERGMNSNMVECVVVRDVSTCCCCLDLKIESCLSKTSKGHAESVMFPVSNIHPSACEKFR